MLHCKQQGGVTFRPTLEVLEGRLTPTTNFHWKGGHIGNPTDWDDGRNWVDDYGVEYTRSRYPGTISDEDVAIFDSATATTDCDFSSTDGPLAGMSSDANFAFNVNLNGNLAVDGDLALRGERTTSTVPSPQIIRPSSSLMSIWW